MKRWKPLRKIMNQVYVKENHFKMNSLWVDASFFPIKTQIVMCISFNLKVNLLQRWINFVK